MIGHKFNKNFYHMICILCCFFPVFAQAEINEGKTLKPYRGIIRVETKVSAGLNNFEEIVLEARKHDLDFIVISDQLLVEVEYGIFPFKNIFEVYKTRPSIMSYGIEKYFKELKVVDAKYKDIIVIPGADVAPFYFWEGWPLPNKLKCNQYSQQLTVFGIDSPEFYRKIPMIHNEFFEFSFENIIKLWPLLFVIWGIYLILFRNIGISKDSLNSQDIPRRRMIIGVILCITGFLWVVNNKPFFHSYPYDQYSEYGNKPYKLLANYVKEHPDAEKILSFWSAPGITMENEIYGVKLITNPYWGSVKSIDGFDGFAGVYGDALDAYLPGNHWDRMLLSYINGERSSVPFIIGEIDYHQKKRRIDNIQTVVFAEKFSMDFILRALKNGNSYGYFQYGDFLLNLKNVSINNDGNKYLLGESFQIKDDKVILDISGLYKWSCVSGNPDNSEISSLPKLNRKKSIRIPKSKLIIVCNSKVIKETEFTKKSFNLQIPINLKEEKDRGYIRFYIQSPTAGLIVSNPFFYNKISSKLH